MQLDQIETLFDASPVMRLLRSESAPFVIDFLNGAFKKSGELSIGHEEFKQRLLIYLEHLHEYAPDSMSGSVDRYMVHWSDNGWLKRHVDSTSSETQYQLTRHAEDAIQFVDALLSRRTGLVGTESRLRLIIETLNDLVQGASSDPDERLRRLRQQQDDIQAEIDAIELGRPVEVYMPSQIRERFQMAVGLLKSLQSDFRAVEERFRHIAMQVQKDQQAASETRGMILGNAMDAEDLLKTEDEGISFYAFIAFLFSPDSQQTLRQTIEDVVQLEPIQHDRDSIARLRYMVRSLLREADKVLATNGRLTTSLRKLLDINSAENRLQTAEVLREIRQLAVSLRDEPVADSACQLKVQSAAAVSSPFSRTFWTTPQAFEGQPEEHVVELERVVQEQSSLANMEFLDLEKLRGNVAKVTRISGQATLAELMEAFPPESGIVELVGYFQIAFEDGHTIVRENRTDCVVVDADTKQRTRVRVPQVLFRTSDVFEKTTPAVPQTRSVPSQPR